MIIIYWVVLHDGMIFSEPVARNIAVNKGEVNVIHLKKAVHIVNIHENVGFPLKHNTILAGTA